MNELTEGTVIAPGFEGCKVLRDVKPGDRIELTEDTVIEGDLPLDAIVLLNGWQVYVTGTSSLGSFA